MKTEQILKDTVKLVDLATARGAWRGEELLMIGQFRAEVLKTLAELTAVTVNKPSTPPSDDPTRFETEVR